MRRLVIVVATLLLIVLLLGGVAVAVLFRRSSLDAMIVPDAVNVQIEREGWEHAQISYTLPVPTQGVSRQLDLQLQREGWLLSNIPTIVSSIYDPDPPPQHYFRTFGPNWIHESIFIRSIDSRDNAPARIQIVVLRSFSWPYMLRPFMRPFSQ